MKNFLKILFGLALLVSLDTFAVDPVYQSVPLGYFMNNRAPTASEPAVDFVVTEIVGAGVDASKQYYLWYNTANSNVYQSTGLTSGSMTWNKLLFSSNTVIGTSRQWTTVSLAFNTARTPSTTNDTKLIGNFTLNTVVGGFAEVDLQLSYDSGSTWRTVATRRIGSLLFSTKDIIGEVTIPPGVQYKFISSVGLTASTSLDLVQELPN